MKTQGEIEAAICEGINRFEREYMDRGPKPIDAHLINDLLVAHLHGVLTAAEQQLVTSFQPGEDVSRLAPLRVAPLHSIRLGDDL